MPMESESPRRKQRRFRKKNLARRWQRPEGNPREIPRKKPARTCTTPRAVVARLGFRKPRGSLAFSRWIRAHVREIESYKPPDLEAIAAGAGKKVDQLIRLDANENPFGPSPRVAQALAKYSAYAYYPDYRPLQKAVARYAGVAAEQVVLGNGADELIDLIMRLALEPGQGLIICPPAFGMYRFFAQLNRHPVWDVPRDEDWAVDVAAIEALAHNPDPGRPRLLLLTSPGNPDGQMIPLDLVERLLRMPLLVVLDEAYIEFGGPTARPLLSQHDNLILIRTFSKWAGLAGLRLGYTLLSAEMAGYLECIRAPYNVNAAAMAAALATLDDLEAVQDQVTQLVAERERLQHALAELPWLEALPSAANFILCRVRGRSGGEVAQALAGQGILIRSFGQAPLKKYIRISVGRPEQNRALLNALGELPYAGAD